MATELVQQLLSLHDPSYVPIVSNGGIKTALNKLLSYTNHTHQQTTITSWKMSDFAYKKEPCPFPTRARGLFTTKLQNNHHKIVARGYDKFFNIDEVSWTKWDNLEKLTAAPYELTHKSNGCIILIAAIDPTHLLVTSKHSIGKTLKPHEDGRVEQSHSERGEYWLNLHLQNVGKTRTELAQTLFEQDLTAVAELCDDSFEEHVLPYPSHLTGLHLHGLNKNTVTLFTLPSITVQQFAQEWGMIPTPFSIFPSITAIREYCATIESAGGIIDEQGQVIPVEGFVIRGIKIPGLNLLAQPLPSTSSSSKQELEPFFWKVKFDEPYLMYRSWREYTRKILAVQPETSPININKIQHPLTKLYIFWIEREIRERLYKFSQWNRGRDIIKIRQEFLDWTETEEGREKALQVGAREEVRSERTDWERTLIVPVAIPGAGKTSLGIALRHLFGFGHTQSDDFPQKKSGPPFINSVRNLLVDHPVVFADKNNHIISLRKNLLDVAHTSPLPTRALALIWSTSTTPTDTLQALSSERILSRGKNHQNLRGTDVDYFEILRKFFGSQEEWDVVCGRVDAGFEGFFMVEWEWSLGMVIEKVCGFLLEQGVIERLPTDVEMKMAMEKVEEYKVEEKVLVNSETSKKLEKKKVEAKPRYYGISVEVDLQQLLKPYFENGEEIEMEKNLESMTFRALIDAQTIDLAPHVTLVHEFEVKSAVAATESTETEMSAPNLWNYYKDLVNAPIKHQQAIEKQFAADSLKLAQAVKKAQKEAAKARRNGITAADVEIVSTISAVASDTTKKDWGLDVEISLGPLLVWDSRVMAIQVSMRPLAAASSNTNEEARESTKLGLVGNKEPHITIGTLSNDIRPIEGKFILEAALRGETSTEFGGKIFTKTIPTAIVRGFIAGLR